MMTQEQQNRTITLFDASSKRITEVLTQLDRTDVPINTISVDCCSLESTQLQKLITLCSRFPLERLYLRGNGIDAEGVGSISRLLCQPQCSIKELDLRWNNLGDSGVASLAVALHANCCLEKLFLSRNTIGNKGAQFLANALMSGNTNLQFLDLEENVIGSAGISAFGAVLSQNHYLHALQLEGNFLNSSPDSLSSSYALLASALLSNVSLTKITLPKPNVTVYGANNLSYWNNIIEQHLRRNSMLKMKSEVMKATDLYHTEVDNSNEPTVDIPNIRKMLEKHENQLFSHMVQLQKRIQSSDLVLLRQQLNDRMDEQNNLEKKKFDSEKTKMEKKLESCKTSIEKLEKSLKCSNVESSQLNDVIQEVETQNKQLTENVNELQKKVRNCNQRLVKLKNKNEAYTEHIMVLQDLTENQRKQIQDFQTEKLIHQKHTKVQIRELQKKFQILLRLAENMWILGKETENGKKFDSSKMNILGSGLLEIKSENFKEKHFFEEEKQNLVECVICQDAEKCIAFVPCGHICTCVSCSEELTVCPVCRTPCKLKCRIYQ